MAGGLVNAGQKLDRNLSAREWNDVRAKVLGAQTATLLGAAGPSDARDGIIRILNQTGQGLDQGAVVGLKDPLILPSENTFEFGSTLCFNGVVPTDGSGESTDYRGQFAVLLEPCGAGDIAAAIVAGVTAAKLSVTAAGDKFADIKHDDVTALKTGSSGSARVLWKEPGTGEKFGVVILGSAASGATPRRAKLDATLSYGETAEATVWEWDAEEEEYVETDETVEVQCWLLYEDESIEGGTRIWFLEVDGVNEVVAAACAPEPEEEEEESPGGGGEEE